MRWIVGIFVLLMIKPILYLLKGLWFIAELFFMFLFVKILLGTMRWIFSLGKLRLDIKKCGSKGA